MIPTKACPDCTKADLDPSGICPACGYKEPVDPSFDEQPAQSESESRPMGGLIEMDYSVSDESRQEVPEWRRDLARRLQEIKTKRETPPQAQSAPVTTLPADESAPPAGEATAPEKPTEPERRLRRPVRQPRPVSRPEPVRQPAEAALPLFRSTVPPTLPEVFPPAPPKESSLETGAIEALIDRAVARQSAPPPGPIPPPLPQLSFQTTPKPIHRPPPEPTPKLILLSRTLAGLVDLVIVMFCGAAVVIATDIFSGIEVMDTFSMVNYGVLVLAMFFVYSTFFLFTAAQTVGMMITDLRLTGDEEQRPRVSQILLRCGLFAISLLAVGLGLLWGCVDRDARCFHDRFSGTKVIRIPEL
jgi:uncharacterized RDD family membrane protein YckC